MPGKRLKEVQPLEDIMQIRFQFKRGEDLKFIGHLDIMRLFERAFKRSGLPIAHSQGFNPRPRIIFGQPMPLGLTSDGEFADVELMERIEPGQFIRIMNGSLPPGIQLTDAKEKRNPSNLMAIVAGARYRIHFDAPESFDIQKTIEEVLARDEINVMKKTKSGETEKNIRPFIYELTGEANKGHAHFDVLLEAGPENNIRPELFLTGVSDVCHTRLELRAMHRFILLGRRETHWLSLLDEKML